MKNWIHWQLTQIRDLDKCPKWLVEKIDHIRYMNIFFN